MRKKNRPKKRKNNRIVLLGLIICFGFSCSGKVKSGCDDGSEFIVDIPETIEIPQDTLIVSKTALELYLDSLGFVNIQEKCPSVKVDLKYAGTDNFTGKVLYKELNRAYLHPYAMDKLAKAQDVLQSDYPNYSLLVYDALRPLSVQREMYDAVKNTPYKSYVANPERKSLHNYGMAVDLTMCDENGIPLDMGTEFDYFGATAGINNEEEFIDQGKLTRKQVENREILRKAMKKAGFMTIKGEWWHFNACSLHEAGKISTILSDL